MIAWPYSGAVLAVKTTIPTYVDVCVKLPKNMTSGDVLATIGTLEKVTIIQQYAHLLQEFRYDTTNLTASVTGVTALMGCDHSQKDRRRLGEER